MIPNGVFPLLLWQEVLPGMAPWRKRCRGYRLHPVLRVFLVWEAASTMSSAVMGMLSALMELCGSEGTC